MPAFITLLLQTLATLIRQPRDRFHLLLWFRELLLHAVFAFSLRNNNNNSHDLLRHRKLFFRCQQLHQHQDQSYRNRSLLSQMGPQLQLRGGQLLFNKLLGKQLVSQRCTINFFRQRLSPQKLARLLLRWSVNEIKQLLTQSDCELPMRA